jgi:hypothetical protein
MQREANEVVVGEVGDPSKYADLCIKLLKVAFILNLEIALSIITATGPKHPFCLNSIEHISRRAQSRNSGRFGEKNCPQG